MSIPAINQAKTSENIKKLMKDKGLSVRDLQKKLNLTGYGSIYEWLRGRCLPSIDNLVALSAIFEVEIEKILVLE